jgi:Fur family peroxide stress response transcriptional regulator
MRNSKSGVKLRASKQRERILEILQNTGIHPTARWIYEQLVKEFPSLSIGNIYRNIAILVDQGLVKKVDFGSAFDRLDANTSRHYHFICETCGSIIDLQIPYDAGLDERLNSNTHFRTRRHTIEFYGTCEKCLEKKDERG